MTSSRKSSVLLICNPVETKLRGPESVKQLLSDALCFAEPRARWMASFKAGMWDGNIRLFDWRRGTFPTGLVDRVIRLLSSKGYEVGLQIIGRPAKCFPHADRLIGIQLRSFQIAACDQAIRQCRAYIQAPTASGKTEIGIEIIRRLGLPTLWLVHKGDLLTQTSARIRDRLGIPVGVFGSGKMNLQWVTVGMVQTLRSVIDPAFWSQWSVLIMDECHHASAPTWYDVANQCCNAFYRFGLSATPGGQNQLRDAKLEAVTGKLIVAAEMQQMIDLGFLAAPRIVLLRPSPDTYPKYEDIREAICPNWRDNPQRLLGPLGGKLFSRAYRLGVIQNRTRNQMLVDVVRKHWQQGEKVMVLCSKIEHGDLLYRLFTSAKIEPLWWLSGDERIPVRDDSLKAYRAVQAGAVMLASPIFQEGVDVPEIDVLVLAGGGASEKDTLQKVGRALRIRPDKTEVLIYDVLDGRQLGSKKDYLRDHTIQRLSSYAKQNFSVDLPSGGW